MHMQIRNKDAYSYSFNDAYAYAYNLTNTYTYDIKIVSPH